MFRPLLRIFTLLACAQLGVACRSDSTAKSPARILADSVADFTGTQGQRNWHYGYWDRSAADASYEQAADFKPLTHFGDDAIHGITRRTEFSTGPIWSLQDGVHYTALWADGGHPQRMARRADDSAAEHWAVRRWISTIDGRVTITGHAGKVMPWGANWNGGCIGRIVVDGREVYSTAMDNHGVDYSVEVVVRKGSLVDFLIGPDTGWGVMTYTAVIRSASLQER